MPSIPCFDDQLVWKAKARFIHKKFLAAYEDHEKDGIFEADPSLNKFLATATSFHCWTTFTVGFRAG